MWVVRWKGGWVGWFVGQISSDYNLLSPQAGAKAGAKLGPNGHIKGSFSGVVTRRRKDSNSHLVTRCRHCLCSCPNTRRRRFCVHVRISDVKGSCSRL